MRSAEAGNVLFVEGVDANELTSKVRKHYAGVIEFDGDRICAWRDYLDGGLFKGAMSGGRHRTRQTTAVRDGV